MPTQSIDNGQSGHASAQWWKPAFLDLVLAGLVLWLFVMSPRGWSALLADGDTGWHIRTGEWILAHRSVPYQDLFSFTKTGETWFAWEWLADLIFALLHQIGGLPLLTFFCGFLLLLSATLLLRYMSWRGSGPIVAFPIFLLSIGGSTVHYLARPHVFSLLFLVLTLWLLDRERRQASQAIWLLVPLTLLWTNLHGAWPVLFVLLLTQVGVRFLAGDPHWKRESLVLLACAGATLLNPYGWHLHQHILSYVQSDWIRESVDEFQSPKFRSESVLQFEVLLLGSVAAAWARMGRDWRGRVEAILILVWAHLSLGSVRHIPIFILVAAPALATEASLALDAYWKDAAKSSLAGIFRELNLDLKPRFQAISVWSLIFCGLLWWSAKQTWPADFPRNTFPVAALGSTKQQLENKRIFMSDQWGDYWIYQTWPTNRIFIDGRSDFYGPALGRESLRIASAAPGWESALDRWQVKHAVLPPESALAQAMRQANWQVLYKDQLAAVLVHPGEAKGGSASAPGKSPSKANESSDLNRIHRGEDLMKHMALNPQEGR